MADRQQSSDSDTCSEEGCVVDKGLENFITEHYERQKEEGHMDTAEVSDERRNSFFERALKESQRMSMEVEKSHKKIDKLHSELGGETFASWRAEHAAEVLNPRQVAAVEAVSHPQNPQT